MKKTQLKLSLAAMMSLPLCLMAQQPRLSGGVADIYTRVTAAVAKTADAGRTCRMKAWRGERVHAQVVVRSDRPLERLRLGKTELRADGAAPITLSPRPVREIEGVSDLLDDPETASVGSNRFLAVWVTAEVPRNASPGMYRGTFTVSAAGSAVLDFPVELEVLPATLPEKNTFYLDLWQNVCAVARYHRVKPYSKAHYAVLEPLLKELAAAGQKAVTVPICAYPWGKGYLTDEFVPVITDVRYRDGRCELDFTLFDEFVEFARGCGIGPQIHCYTILKFAHRFDYWYIEGETGQERKIRLDPDTPEWKAFWRPFLAKFEAHVREKGWLKDTYIAVDEADPKDQFSTVAFLKEFFPSLKYACAANKDGRLFKGLEADVFSQIIWKDYCSREFLDTISERRAKGRITTFYVCTQPQKPNTWFKSPLIETQWMGLFAAAERFDGFLRWAVFHWPADPFVKVKQNYFPAGEEILLYPGCKASLRWEILRDSIENYRKIESLRAADGSLPPKLAAALEEIDFESAKTDNESAYRAKIGAVLDALDEAACGKPPSGLGREALDWENGRRAETLDWFRRELFGYSPPRPADQKFDDEGVSFGGMKIRVHYRLPEGASRDNPAPAIILIDHYNGNERKDGRWHRAGTPTNSIVERGFAYVNFNVNDVALNCYNHEWSNKVHRVYGGGRPDSWGTISAWAWGVSRVMDWIERRPEIDVRRVGVIGHSRGGKTALWAAAQDERIALAIPNGSGTGGTRLMSMKMPKAESLDWMLNASIKFWYCPNAQKFKGGKEFTLEHDADDLIRLVCPRLVYVGSGSKDEWAGPEGEFESARRASSLWRSYGMKGLSISEFPAAGTWANEGRVGYMLHDGPHQLTAWNWERVLDFADKHLK